MKESYAKKTWDCRRGPWLSRRGNEDSPEQKTGQFVRGGMQLSCPGRLDGVPQQDIPHMVPRIYCGEQNQSGILTVETAPNLHRVIPDWMTPLTMAHCLAFTCPGLGFFLP